MNPAALSYTNLRKARAALKRKLKDRRKHHRPSDRLVAAIQEATTEMLKREVAR